MASETLNPVASAIKPIMGGPIRPVSREALSPSEGGLGAARNGGIAAEVTDDGRHSLGT